MIRKLRKNNSSDQRRNSDSTYERATTGFSYHSNRSNRDSSMGRYNREEQSSRSVSDRTKLLKNLPAFLAVIVLIVSIIYAITLNSNPRIEIVGSSSNSFLQPVSSYKLSASKLLQGSFLNGTKLTINTDSIASKLSSEYPELDGVTVVIPLLGHQPIVEIKPSHSIIVLANSQGSFLLNQNGTAILNLSPQTQMQQFASLPLVTDQSGLVVKLGEQVIPTSTITFINTVIDQFAAKSIPIQSMTLVAVPYELNVQVRGVPYYIKFNLLSDPNYSIGTYLATVKELATLKATPTQYIDVRIPGRAYYQ